MTLPVDFPVSVRWHNGELSLLDQTQLPHTVSYEQPKTAQQLWDAIHQLKVRGAPAIGIAAAYGLCVLMREQRSLPSDQFRQDLQKQAGFLNSSRPTAVNLWWALGRMLDVPTRNPDADNDTLLQALVSEAESIHAEDRALCQAIGEQGLSLISEGAGIMTHCNAGALATGGIGTATAPLYLAHQAGRYFKVFANETRPLLQGARLTSWELHCAGIDVTLITDNMAAHILASGAVQLIIVGTDRVAANGDVANKIGTLGLAILASHYKIPFYVACPSSTIDLQTASGKAIPIEQRHGDEIRRLGTFQATLPDIPVSNPAFDITPATLVSGIITEKGILRPPFADSLQAQFGSQGKKTGLT